jgi:DsbC/DsbD-like thiol-disulfide interchange protein
MCIVQSIKKAYRISMILNRTLSFLACLLACLFSAQHTHADIAITDTPHVKVRLLEGAQNPKTGDRLAGLAITLAPEFKTYWRHAGDSGIPPRFDESGSSNLQSLSIAWPMPHRFGEPPMESIGYKDDVLLPLTLKPIDPKKPITLVLKLDFAICSTICIPAQAKLAKVMEGKGTDQNLIKSWQAKVPQKVSAAADKGPRLTASLSKSEKNESVLTLTLSRTKTQDVELFLDHENHMMAVPFKTGPETFEVPLGKGQSGPQAPTVTATVRDGQQSYEMPLDLSAVKP